MRKWQTKKKEFCWKPSSLVSSICEDGWCFVYNLDSLWTLRAGAGRRQAGVGEDNADQEARGAEFKLFRRKGL